MIDHPSEPAHKIRVDVWVRGRIADLLKKATPQQRKELEEEIDRYFRKLQKRKDDKPQPERGTWDELYQLLGLHEGKDEKLRIDPFTLIGPEFAAGREARLQSAQRLIGEKKYLEAELHLLQVRGRRDDPARAARALEMLGQLMTTQGQFRDAVY